MGHVTELTDSNFTDEVADGVALVDFWAPWCGPCKIQLPILQKLAEALGNRAKIAKINVDENPDTAQQFKVQGIPTMVLLKNCLLYTSPSPRDRTRSRMPSSA